MGNLIEIVPRKLYPPYGMCIATSTLSAACMGFFNTLFILHMLMEQCVNALVFYSMY